MKTEPGLIDNRPKRKFVEGVAVCGRCKRETPFKKTLLSVDEQGHGIYERPQFVCSCILTAENSADEGFVCSVYMKRT